MGIAHTERLRLKIVQQFQNNVPQREIAKNLGMSSSTVHNIIKRFRESGGITVRKRQGRKPILDVGELRQLRKHWSQNKNESVMDVTVWAQENFKKKLAVNTVRRYIHQFSVASSCGTGESETMDQVEGCISGSVGVQTSLQSAVIKKESSEFDGEAFSARRSPVPTDSDKDLEEAEGDSTLQEHSLHTRMENSGSRDASDIEEEDEGLSKTDSPALTNSSSGADLNKKGEKKASKAGPNIIQTSLWSSAEKAVEQEEVKTGEKNPENVTYFNRLGETDSTTEASDNNFI